MKILHQLGHNYIWNLDSLQDDTTGDGLIISPVDVSLEDLKKRFPQEVLSKSFFDPQLYSFDAMKSKLQSYPYLALLERDSNNNLDLNKQKDILAKYCSEFQTKMDFEGIIIPAIHKQEIPNKYFLSNHIYFGEPFIKSIQGKFPKKPLYLTLILSRSDILDEEMRSQILNRFTSYRQIDGIYLIFDFAYPSKQIKEPALLFEAMKFIYYLRYNGLKVIVGYTNLEGLLYAFSGATAITMGAYENTRKFSYTRFDRNHKSPPSQPKLKIFVRKMLQWINLDYLAMMQNNKYFETVFDDNKYFSWSHSYFHNWHLSQPETFKHYFLSYDSLFRELHDGDRISFDKLINSIDTAIELFKKVDDALIILDPNQNGEHLYYWKTALLKFNDWMESYGEI